MVQQRLLDILVCPWCLGELDHADDRLTCTKCRSAYAVQDDIPNMLVEEADLTCPACEKLLEKCKPYAACNTCGRRYRMDVRISDTLAQHAERACPACSPEGVELPLDRDECECPRCGAHFPAEQGAAPAGPDP